MKMKYHKISNVDINTCTAEQKIAYNMAFRADVSYGDAFRKLDTAIAKDEAVHDIIRHMFDQYHAGYDYKAGRYNLLAGASIDRGSENIYGQYMYEEGKYVDCNYGLRLHNRIEGDGVLHEVDVKFAWNRGYADEYRSKYGKEFVNQIAFGIKPDGSKVNPDAHSLNKERVNGVVSNMDGWYDAFDIKEGALFRAPADRIHIW